MDSTMNLFDVDDFEVPDEATVPPPQTQQQDAVSIPSSAPAAVVPPTAVVPNNATTVPVAKKPHHHQKKKKGEHSETKVADDKHAEKKSKHATKKKHVAEKATPVTKNAAQREGATTPSKRAPAAAAAAAAAAAVIDVDKDDDEDETFSADDSSSDDESDSNGDSSGSEQMSDSEIGSSDDDAEDGGEGGDDGDIATYTKRLLRDSTQTLARIEKHKAGIRAAARVKRSTDSATKAAIAIRQRERDYAFEHEINRKSSSSMPARVTTWYRDLTVGDTTLTVGDFVTAWGCTWKINDMVHEAASRRGAIRLVQWVPVSQVMSTPPQLARNKDTLIRTNRYAIIPKVSADVLVPVNPAIDENNLAYVCTPVPNIHGKYTPIVPDLVCINQMNAQTKNAKMQTPASNLDKFVFSYFAVTAKTEGVGKLLKEHFFTVPPINCRFSAEEGYERPMKKNKRSSPTGTAAAAAAEELTPPPTKRAHASGQQDGDVTESSHAITTKIPPNISAADTARLMFMLTALIDAFVNSHK